MYCYDCMKEIKDGSNVCCYCSSSTQPSYCPHHLKPGTVLNNRYLVGNSIGEGGFGITYIGRDTKLEYKIAIKEFYPSGFANRNNTVSNEVTLNYQNEGEYFKTGVDNFLREAKSIAKFNNESSIVDVRDFFEENGTAYIIMEYLEGENLSEKLKRDGKFEAEDIFTMFLPMMNTLDKMHRENIIHRDISPDNIRVKLNGELMLMDFGSARYYTGMEKKTMSVQFKPGYAPFEQYNKNGNQGPWTDVYGLCATIYKCVTGVTPVDALERVQTDTLKKPSELGVQISEPLENIIMYGMAVYPENRCSSMRKLKTMTEQALGGKKTIFIRQNNSVTADNNRTMLADRTYGDTSMFNSGANKTKKPLPPKAPVKEVKQTKVKEIDTSNDRYVIPEYLEYQMQLDELNSKFASKEKSTRDLIAKRFEPPQLTYTRFISGVDKSAELFKSNSESAYTMISLTSEYSPRIAGEIEKKIDILKKIVEKLDSLSNELILNDDISDKKEDVDTIIEDMDNLIDSVKDYD